MKKNKFTTLYIISAFMIILGPRPTLSQYGPYGSTDSRSMGMANTYTAAAFNVFSIGKNPALLAYPTNMDSTVIALIPHFSTQFYTNSMSFNEVNHYFGLGVSRYLTESDKNKLYNYLGNNGRFYFDVSANSFSAAWTPSRNIGSFAFSANDFVSGYVFLPGDLVDLALNGNAIDRTYTFDDFELQASWVRVFSISYAKDVFRSNGTIKTLTSGASLKLITGYANIEYFGMSSYFHTDEKHGLSGSINASSRSSFADDFGVDYNLDNTGKGGMSYFSSPAGIGYGFDIGFACETNYGLIFGFAITDIGVMNWESNAAEHKISGVAYVDDLTDKDELDSLLNLFSSKSEPVPGYETKLPMTLRIGVSYDIAKTITFLPGSLLVAADLNQGLIDQALTTLKPRLSVGALWQPASFLPYFSSGITYDQTGASRWSFGTGFGYSFFNIGLSTYDLSSLISGGKNSPQLSFAVHLAWIFDYNAPEIPAEDSPGISENDFRWF